MNADIQKTIVLLTSTIAMIVVMCLYNLIPEGFIPISVLMIGIYSQLIIVNINLEKQKRDSN